MLCSKITSHANSDFAVTGSNQLYCAIKPKLMFLNKLNWEVKSRNDKYVEPAFQKRCYVTNYKTRILISAV